MPQQTQAIPFFQLRTVGQGPYLKRALWPRAVPQVPVVYAGGTSYTEFFCRAGGSNINAGAQVENTEPSVTPKYTSTNGSWSTTTLQFTPSDGTNPVAAGVRVGDFASLYTDGITQATCITRIVGVTNAVNGPITITASAIWGTFPSTSATTRSITVGGAWAGPSGSVGFPFTLGGSYPFCTNANGDKPRVNLKNDQVYSLTAGLGINASGLVSQGYSAAPGDGGKAIYTANVAGPAYAGAQGCIFADLVFTNTVTTGANDMWNLTVACSFYRCVFHGSRRSGVVGSGTGGLFVECEFYDNNKSNTAGIGHINSPGQQPMFFINCYFHSDPSTGALCGGIITGASSPQLNILGTIFSGLTTGVSIAANGAGFHSIANCDFYNLTGDAIAAQGTDASIVLLAIRNCNFVKCGRAMNAITAGQGGYLMNCGYADNQSADILKSMEKFGTVIYPAGTTPWKSPSTGDFRINNLLAICAGRGVFTETDGVNSGTVGYPDIGAAMHQDSGTRVGQGGDVVQPYGYVGYYYEAHETLAPTTNIVVTIDSGALPPGLSLVTLSSSEWMINGTPTTVGSYTFVLKTVSAGSGVTGYTTEHITIFQDPNEGTGGVGGG